MKVKIKVLNMPKERSEGRFMVVRLCDARLWYYGTYDDESRAIQAALEIGNGLVVEVDEDVDGI